MVQIPLEEIAYFLDTMKILPIIVLTAACSNELGKGQKLTTSERFASCASDKSSRQGRFGRQRTMRSTAKYVTSKLIRPTVSTNPNTWDHFGLIGEARNFSLQNGRTSVRFDLEHSASGSHHHLSLCRYDRRADRYRARLGNVIQLLEQASSQRNNSSKVGKSPKSKFQLPWSHDLMAVEPVYVS